MLSHSTQAELNLRCHGKIPCLSKQSSLDTVAKSKGCGCTQSWLPVSTRLFNIDITNQKETQLSKPLLICEMRVITMLNSLGLIRRFNELLRVERLGQGQADNKLESLPVNYL